MGGLLWQEQNRSGFTKAGIRLERVDNIHIRYS